MEKTYQVTQPISVDEKKFKIGDKVTNDDVRPYLLDFIEQGALKEISAASKPLSLTKEN